MRTKVTAFPLLRGRSYRANLGEAASQALGAVFGLNANLTFSAYCGWWRQRQTPFLRHLHRPVNWLFRDLEHCQRSWSNRT